MPLFCLRLPFEDPCPGASADFQVFDEKRVVRPKSSTDKRLAETLQPSNFTAVLLFIAKIPTLPEDQIVFSRENRPRSKRYQAVLADF
jgi:hypothetical protein